ncbi:MAG: hypothetical protein R2828_34045 [Saprospiraceae bacterium]
MKKSKLIALLASFDQTDFRQFCEFVASPFFNKNQELIFFVDYLETLAPEFTTDKVKKADVFRALYPGEAFDKKKMAYLMNYLLKLGEHFLAIQRYQKEEILMKYHVLDQFVERKLDKHYHYLLHKTQENLQEMKNRDEQAYYYQYLIGKVASDYFYSQQVRKFDPSLQMVSDELDQFYFFHKLKYSCEMLNRQAIITAEYHLTFVDELRSYLLNKEEIDPLIEIYLRIFLSIKHEEEEEHFEKLMHLIENYTDTVNDKIRREIYLYALNYCAPKIRKGKEKYIPIMLDLYIKGIENKALFDGAYLSHWTYSNVIKLALRLERFEWTETFIKENAICLPPQLREGAEHYNLSELYYHKRDFDQVLNHLNQLHFTDLHYHLGSRVILLKTYYELEAEEPLLSLLSSFSVYLRRNNTISPPLKKTYLNFCNLLHQILRRNPKKWDALGQDINNTQPLAERAWLLQLWKQEQG